VIKAATSTAIFDAVLSGRMRLKYCDFTEYHDVKGSRAIKKKHSARPFRRLLSQSVSKANVGSNVAILFCGIIFVLLYSGAVAKKQLRLAWNVKE
jgi:hypothetical protein